MIGIRFEKVKVNSKVIGNFKLEFKNGEKIEGVFRAKRCVKSNGVHNRIFLCP